MSTIGIIGGGMSGICSARSCMKEGLVPVVYEETAAIGGHWSLSEGPVTGVFNNLTSNTPFYETVTTDLLPLRSGANEENGPEASLFLRPQEWNENLQHMVDSTPGLREQVKLNCKVNSVRKDAEGSGYILKVTQEGETTEIRHERIIIATSRNQVPTLPHVSGMARFKGRIYHGKEYRSPLQFQDQDVLIVGGSISATECAGDLADTVDGYGPKSVTLLTRSMKHYVEKQKDMRSYSSVHNTSISSLLLLSGSHSMAEETERWMKGYKENFTTNEDYGLPVPQENAGFYPTSSRFLRAARDKRKLAVRTGEIKHINNKGKVILSDDDMCDFDAIVFATGYTIELPMLDQDKAANSLYASSSTHKDDLNLYMRTWSPEFPRCAFVGIYNIDGLILPLIDIQSRWVARCFADSEVQPSVEEIQSGVNDLIAARQLPGYSRTEFHTPLMYEFAEKIGCSIDYFKYPQLAKSLLCGPMVPMQFSICGHGRVSNPRKMYREAVKLTGIDLERIRVTDEDIELLELCLESFENTDSVPKGFRKALKKIKREHMLRNLGCPMF